MRVRVPDECSLKTQFRLVKNTFPYGSAATLWGKPIDDFKALAGVGGGAPPAYVEIMYCCPRAVLAVSKTDNPSCRMKIRFLSI